MNHVEQQDWIALGWNICVKSDLETIMCSNIHRKMIQVSYKKLLGQMSIIFFASLFS